MIMQKTARLSILAVPLLAAVLLALTLVPSEAASFRDEFTDSYVNQRFYYLTTLVKDNREVIPSEVDRLVDEALATEERGERMRLLDIASAMATMHEAWNGDGAPLEKVTRVIKDEIAKEEARAAERKKWASFEAYTGNILYMNSPEKLKEAGFAPVVFPHWRHRVFYGCTSCHDGRFKQARSVIRHSDFKGGGSCAGCHDGKAAFGASDVKVCGSCHNATAENAGRLNDPGSLDPKKAGVTAARAGSGFNASKLKDGRLPLDRFGEVDWPRAETEGAISPKAPATKEVRTNTILFKSPMSFVGDVPFGHESHSTRVECGACHPGIFQKELGATGVKMSEMGDGVSCGECHGKVSFKQADCFRCHTGSDGIKERPVLERKMGP